MYRELEAELARNGMSKRKLSEKTGINYNTLLGKLNGQYPITFDECLSIKKALKYKAPLETLFFDIKHDISY